MVSNVNSLKHFLSLERTSFSRSEPLFSGLFQQSGSNQKTVVYEPSVIQTTIWAGRWFSPLLLHQTTKTWSIPSFFRLLSQCGMVRASACARGRACADSLGDGLKDPLRIANEASSTTDPRSGFCASITVRDLWCIGSQDQLPAKVHMRQSVSTVTDLIGHPPHVWFRLLCSADRP